MIQAFTDLTEDLKRRRIKIGFHFMDIEASTDLNMTMNSMHIKYKLVPSSSHRANNGGIEIQNFKKHFISGLFSIDKDFHLKL